MNLFFKKLLQRLRAARLCRPDFALAPPAFLGRDGSIDLK
jgi:hypothetical protein